MGNETFTIKYSGVLKYLSDAHERILRDALSEEFSGIEISSTYRSDFNQAEAMIHNTKRTGSSAGFMYQLRIYGKDGDGALINYFKKLATSNKEALFKEYEVLYNQFKKANLEGFDSKALKAQSLKIAEKLNMAYKALKSKDSKKVTQDDRNQIKLIEDLGKYIKANLQFIDKERTKAINDKIKEVPQLFKTIWSFPLGAPMSSMEYKKVLPLVKKVENNTRIIENGLRNLQGARAAFEIIHAKFKTNSRFDTNPKTVTSKYHWTEIDKLEIKHFIYCEAVDNFMRKMIQLKESTIAREAKVFDEKHRTKSSSDEFKDCFSGFASAHSDPKKDVADIPVFYKRVPNGKNQPPLADRQAQGEALLKKSGKFNHIMNENRTVHVEFEGNPNLTIFTSKHNPPAKKI